jgi:hypothetical protein
MARWTAVPTSSGPPAAAGRAAAGLDVRHGVEQPARRAAGVEQRQNVRMLQPRLGADLPLEPLDPERSAERRVQHLERDPAPVPRSCAR